MRKEFTNKDTRTSWVFDTETDSTDAALHIEAHTYELSTFIEFDLDDNQVDTLLNLIEDRSRDYIGQSPFSTLYWNYNHFRADSSGVNFGFWVEFWPNAVELKELVVLLEKVIDDN
jgi:hypothetical protein